MFIDVKAVIEVIRIFFDKQGSKTVRNFWIKPRNTWHMLKLWPGTCKWKSLWVFYRHKNVTRVWKVEKLHRVGTASHGHIQWIWRSNLTIPSLVFGKPILSQIKRYPKKVMVQKILPKKVPRQGRGNRRYSGTDAPRNFLRMEF